MHGSANYQKNMKFLVSVDNNRMLMIRLKRPKSAIMIFCGWKFVKIAFWESINANYQKWFDFENILIGNDQNTSMQKAKCAIVTCDCWPLCILANLAFLEPVALFWWIWSQASIVSLEFATQQLTNSRENLKLQDFAPLSPLLWGLSPACSSHPSSPVFQF